MNNNKTIMQQLQNKRYITYISKNSKDKFLETNNYFYYQNGIINNKKNKIKIRWLLFIEILKSISYILMFLSLFFLIPISLFRNLFDFYGLFIIASSIFYAIIWSFNVFFYLGDKFNFFKTKDKETLIISLIREYLKCKYELLNKINLSEKRVVEIKDNLSSKYFAFDSTEIESKNFLKKFPKSWSEINYLEKTEKFVKKFNNYVRLYDLLGFLVSVVLIVAIFLCY